MDQGDGQMMFRLTIIGSIYILFIYILFILLLLLLLYIIIYILFIYLFLLSYIFISKRLSREDILIRQQSQKL